MAYKLFTRHFPVATSKQGFLDTRVKIKLFYKCNNLLTISSYIILYAHIK